MERTNHWSAIYFVILMTFGNYVLFNLLVAILVEGFSSQDDHQSLPSESEVSEDEVRDEKLIYFYDPKDNLEHGQEFPPLCLCPLFRFLRPQQSLRIGARDEQAGVHDDDAELRSRTRECRVLCMPALCLAASCRGKLKRLTSR